MNIRNQIQTTLAAAFAMPDYTPENREDAERLAPSGWDVAAAESTGREDGIPSRQPAIGIAKVDAFATALTRAGVKWHEGSTTPYTRNDGSKAISFPSLGLFKSPVMLAYTLAHEASHWAGAYGPHRHEFDDRPYPVEEVVAETTASLLMAEWGIANEETRYTNLGYVSSWLSADPNPMPPFGMTTRKKCRRDYIAKLVEQRYNDVQAIIKGA